MPLRRNRFERWVRVLSASIFGVVVLGALVAGLYHARKPSNLALNRNVLTSSQFGTVANDHRMLVDGDRSTLGFHTKVGPNESVAIDLGSMQRINRVVVTNRPDCCRERAVPLCLKVSTDGEHYTKLQDRIETFETWTADDLHANARYVRLRLLAVSCLHLAEVEVY